MHGIFHVEGTVAYSFALEQCQGTRLGALGVVAEGFEHEAEPLVTRLDPVGFGEPVAPLEAHEHVGVASVGKLGLHCGGNQGRSGKRGEGEKKREEKNKLKSHAASLQ